MKIPKKMKLINIIGEHFIIFYSRKPRISQWNKGINQKTKKERKIKNQCHSKNCPRECIKETICFMISIHILFLILTSDINTSQTNIKKNYIIEI